MNSGSGNRALLLVNDVIFKMLKHVSLPEFVDVIFLTSERSAWCVFRANHLAMVLTKLSCNTQDKLEKLKQLNLSKPN